MKKYALFLIFIINVFSITLAQAQKMYLTEEQNVYKTILSISKAWSQNNIDTLEKYIHPKYVHTDVRGQILNRSAWLDYVKDRKQKSVTNSSIEFEDVQISIFKEFAFVTGINSIMGLAFTSKENAVSKPRKLRFTQVLKKENDIWKRILFQATYIDSL